MRALISPGTAPGTRRPSGRETLPRMDNSIWDGKEEIAHCSPSEKLKLIIHFLRRPATVAAREMDFCDRCARIKSIHQGKAVRNECRMKFVSAGGEFITLHLAYMR